MHKKEWIGIGFVLFLLIFILDYHCPFYSILGLPCPGCGMTRSLIHFLKGDFQASFRYHPMLIPTGICFLFFLLKEKYRNSILVFWCILMIACYMYRLFFLGLDYNWDSVLGQVLIALK